MPVEVGRAASNAIQRNDRYNKKYFYTNTYLCAEIERKLMAVVKIQNKNRLDTLIARLTMRLGRKPTQQEVVDTSIRMADERFEELLGQLSPVPIIDDEKLQKIQNISEELSDVPWDVDIKNKLNKNDADVYDS